MISRAPQDARMAIRVLLSVGFFKWETQQENDFFHIAVPVYVGFKLVTQQVFTRTCT